jgi:hypothetical protein
MPSKQVSISSSVVPTSLLDTVKPRNGRRVRRLRCGIPESETKELRFSRRESCHNEEIIILAIPEREILDRSKLLEKQGDDVAVADDQHASPSVLFLCPFDDGLDVLRQMIRIGMDDLQLQAELVGQRLGRLLRADVLRRVLYPSPRGGR